MCGPEAISPDTRYMLGCLPGLPNYFVASGFSGMGVGSSGGAGQATAEWILAGKPQDDLWAVDVQRFAAHQYERDYLLARAVEASGRLYALNWPHYQYETARETHLSPLHAVLKSSGACFGNVSGHEVAEWFGEPGEEPRPSYGFAQPAWISAGRAEEVAAQENLALFDSSHMAKFKVSGSDSLAALSSLLTNSPDVAIGESLLSAVLDLDGRLAAFFRVWRSKHSEFLILGEAETAVRDLDLLRSHFAGYGDLEVREATGAYSSLELLGPGAETALNEALSKVSGSEEILVAAEDRLDAACWIAILPRARALEFYKKLNWNGTGPRLIGRHARQALWTASGVPLWMQGISPAATIQECGLQNVVCLRADRPFRGRNALMENATQEPSRKLARLSLAQEEPVLLGHEPVFVRERPVGSIVQAAYALATPTAVGLTYLDCTALEEMASGAACEVLVSGQRYLTHFTPISL